MRPTDAAGTATAITIYAARGETESFQIIVQAPSTGALSNVNVTAPTLGAATSTLYREHYLYLARGSATWATIRNKPLGAGYWPDGLVPFVNPDTGAALTSGTIKGAPFSVAAGQNQPVWVDVSVPRTATAGTYTGYYTVTSDQGNATVSLTLRVWGFVLPVKPALRSSFLYWETSDGGEGRGVLQADRELLRNRLNPISTTPSYERGLIDGYGLASSTLSFWSNAYQSASMPDPPAVADILAEKAKHQTDLYTYCYSADEVSDPAIYPDIKAWGRALHAAGVDQFITMAPVPDLYDDGSGTGRSAVDDWVVLPRTYDKYKTNVLAVQAKGDKVWSYNATQQDDYSPKWLLDYAPINFRIQPGFISASLGLAGVFYWRIDWWTPDVWNGSQNWPSYPGEGVLVYPGAPIGLPGKVAPSMRLKYLRDGVDDYDYVELLKAAGYGEWALSITRSVGPDWSNWTRDPNALEAARRQLGDYLDGLASGDGSVTVTASASPTVIVSAGTTTLAASAVSSTGDEITGWYWSDGGAGGSFSPSATVPSPIYTAPANATASSRTITLTVSATDGSLSGSQSLIITEQAAVASHTVTVDASASPTTIASGASTALSAVVRDSQSHTGLVYAWSDGGAGGTFSPSATVPNPSYRPPANTTGAAITRVLTITVTCKWTAPWVSGSSSVAITETPVTVAAPVASFSAMGTTGVSPRLVQFTDASTGGPTSWAWSFGDGGTSTLQNPSHTYTAAGTYTVALTATNGGGSNTVTKTGFVTVTVAAPVANFSATGTTGVSPRLVQFTDTSTGAPTSWAWSFGDGGTSTLQNPSHTYTTAGTYTVALTAANVGGLNTVTKTGFITVTVAAPVANFSATGTTGVSPRLVQFTDTSTGAPTSWAWSFGDGGTSALQNPSHTYTTAGTYSVALTAANGGGSNTVTKTGFVTVTVAAPVADFSASGTTGAAPRPVQFTDTSTGGPISWAWNFGDGGTSALQHPSHTYAAPGSYTVALTATNAGGANTVTKSGFVTVTVAAPVANFSATGTTGVSPRLVQFTDTSTGAPTSWAWSFGDGGTSTLQNPSHTYVAAGTYPVALTATNAGGSNTVTKTGFVTVTVAAPVANFSAAGTTGPAPRPVQFTDTSTGGPTSWAWSFGDGGTSTLQSPSHTYAAAGTYTVALTATNAGGSNTVTKTGFVTVTVAAPVANFSATGTTGAAPRPVQFTDTSNGAPTSWAWSFGDGGTSALQSPSHTYAAAGTYTVALAATNAGGSNTVTKTGFVTVTVTAPVANFSASGTTGSAPRPVSFTDTSTGAPTSWAWSFGDGGTSALQSPSHTYAAVGTYTVALTATNAGGSNTVTKTGFVTVTPPAPLADFVATGVSGAAPLLTQFADTSTNAPIAWAWDFGDGGTSTLQNPSHTYTAAGTYTVALTATNTGGSNTVTKNGFVMAAVASHLVTVSAVASPTTIASGGTTTLTATARDDQSHTGFSYAWSDNGAGGTFTPSATVSNPSYRPPANTTGAATARVLTVIATCKWTSPWVSASASTAVTEAPVPAAAPVASFSVTATTGPAPCVVQFTDTSTGSPTAWAWEFGDGGTASLRNPGHTYTVAGSYTVVLVATNAGGSDTATRTGFVTVTVPAPVADFTAAGTTGSAPREVEFTDTSMGSPTAWAWDFGDGSTATTQHPRHTYNAAGTYTVALTATNAGGSDIEAKAAFVRVTTAAPIADFSATGTSGTTPLLTQFADTSTGTPTSWSWDFGDGGTSTAQSPSHTYTTAGSYTVALTAANAGGANTVTRVAFVTATVPAPVADFSATGTNGATPLLTQFTDTSTGIPTAWSWDFGDGGSSHEQNPSHTYTTAGSYTVVLTATSAGGDATATKRDFVTVTAAPVGPLASFSLTPAAGVRPLRVVFTDTSTGDPTSWVWDFGDGTTSSEQDPTHTYTEAGVYTVALSVTNAAGSSTDTQRECVTVTIPALGASFSGTPRRGPAPLSVTFADLSAGDPATWSWDFGDGTASDEQTPTHTYALGGAYDVRLLVGGGLGQDSVLRKRYIVVDFSDVPAHHWAYSSVMADLGAGVVSGYPEGTYGPELVVSRDQVAVFISRAVAGGDEYVPTGPATATFPDVTTGHWAYRYVEQAASQGIVLGYPGGDFRPTLSVDRAQMATFVARGVAHATGDTSLSDYTGPDTPEFSDVPTDYWAYAYVSYLSARGVVFGYDDGTYRPESLVTRDQMAVYIARAFSLSLGF